jgi:hypothetical protein
MRLYALWATPLQAYAPFLLQQLFCYCIRYTFPICIHCVHNADLVRQLPAHVAHPFHRPSRLNLLRSDAFSIAPLCEVRRRFVATFGNMPISQVEQCGDKSTECRPRRASMKTMKTQCAARGCR